MKRIAMYAAKYLMLGIAVTLGLLGLLTFCLYAPDIRAWAATYIGELMSWLVSLTLIIGIIATVYYRTK